MPLANCSYCGGLFYKTVTEFCSKCLAKEDEVVTLAKEYLKKFPNTNAYDLADVLGEMPSYIVSLVHKGKLAFNENTVEFVVHCERCGKPTQKGRYCIPCQNELEAEMQTAILQLREKQNEGQSRGYYSR